MYLRKLIKKIKVCVKKLFVLIYNNNNNNNNNEILIK